MGYLISILILVASVLMVLIVVVQNSKGGGLDSSFGNVNQLGGAAQNTETIEKWTWYLASAIAVLSLVSISFVGGGAGEAGSTNIKSQSPTVAPAPPTTPAPELPPAAE